MHLETTNWIKIQAATTTTEEKQVLTIKERIETAQTLIEKTKNLLAEYENVYDKFPDTDLYGIIVNTNRNIGIIKSIKQTLEDN